VGGLGPAAGPGWPMTVRLIGGNLQIDRDAATGHILMTGPAVTVYSGTYYPSK